MMYFEIGNVFLMSGRIFTLRKFSLNKTSVVLQSNISTWKPTVKKLESFIKEGDVEYFIDILSYKIQKLVRMTTEYPSRPLGVSEHTCKDVYYLTIMALASAKSKDDEAKILKIQRSIIGDISSSYILKESK